MQENTAKDTVIFDVRGEDQDTDFNNVVIKFNIISCQIGPSVLGLWDNKILFISNLCRDVCAKFHT